MKKLIIVIIGIIIVLIVLIVYRSNGDFSELKGEIILMQGDSTFPLIKYDAKNKKKLEIMNIFYDAQYDMNNGDNLIVIINKNGQQQIYKINEYQKSDFANR